MAQKLCKAVVVDWAWAECDELESLEMQALLNLFVETLRDHEATGRNPVVCSGEM